MKIGKASKLSNLTVKAVRYYDNIGLVKPHQNIFSGYREYDEKDVLKLEKIVKSYEKKYKRSNEIGFELILVC